MNQSSDIDAIWDGDFMERRNEADYLTNYLQRRYASKPDEKGHVLAINADWGMGKTFFLERWDRQLRHQSHPHLYFDAWKNDYTPEPLIAFIAELNRGLAPYFSLLPKGKQLQQSFMTTAKVVLKPAGKAVGYAVAKHLAGLSVEHMKEMFDLTSAKHGDDDSNLTSQVGMSLKNAVTEALKQHSSTQVAIKEFKEKLTALVEGLKNKSVQLPIFIFVDELDRCRPNYAIELLEGIKHLFGIPGIYFIVATNIAQLGESTRAVYGPGFDGQRYLKRFFDIEYALPEPSLESFAKDLLSQSAIPKPIHFFSGDLPKLLNKTEDKIFAYLIATYARAFDLSLRDLQQVMRIVEASVLSLGEKIPHIHPLLYLSMLYHKDQAKFRQYSRSHKLIDTSIQAVANPEAGIKVPGRIKDIYNEQREPERRIPLIDVFDVYNDSLTRPTMKTHDIKQSDFPKNIRFGIYNENSADRIFDLERYINLISRAGAFS